MHHQASMSVSKVVGSRKYSCLDTYFCYQLIAKIGNKIAALLWPDSDGIWKLVHQYRCWQLLSGVATSGFPIKCEYSCVVACFAWQKGVGVGWGGVWVWGVVCVCWNHLVLADFSESIWCQCIPYLTWICFCCALFGLLFWQLTHWGWAKRATIFQMICSNAFSWMRLYEFL